MTFISCRYAKGMVGIAVPLVLLLAGCAPSHQQELMAKDRLQQARAAYDQATADRDVQNYAPLPLSEAGKALQQAETSTDFVEMENRAYVAEKKVRTAQAIAEGKKAENEVELLRKESAEVLARKREREAERARTEAEMLSKELASRKSEEARALAASSAREAEKSKAEAERLSRELSEQKTRQTEVMREAEKSKAENAQLVKQLSELEAKQTERGVALTLGDVLFPFGKAELSTQARKGIEKLIDFLGSHPNRNALIEGHTDNIGSDTYNMSLSQQRADAVKKMLMDKGIEAKRIAAKGFGKKYPVASNATTHGRQLNRRVEVIVLNEGVKPEAVSR